MMAAMLDRLLKRLRPAPAPGSARLPEGRRVYAVGDVHGRADLLRELHRRIADDAEGAPGERAIVYLGDYVDRGPESRDVLDLLLDEGPAGFEQVTLMGNHEAMLLEFLENAESGPQWLWNGGGATLLSYGVSPPAQVGEGSALEELREALAAALPARHLGFLRGLRLSHVEGGYAFVHAGVRPGLPLELQGPEDLLWIRGEFLNSRLDHGHVVVHGHTIGRDVEIRPNRIALDTGAYVSGRLSALGLEDDRRWLLST
jgi:serine/threonine protein phosphatase 1